MAYYAAETHQCADSPLWVLASVISLFQTIIIIIQ